MSKCSIQQFTSLIRAFSYPALINFRLDFESPIDFLMINMPSSILESLDKFRHPFLYNAINLRPILITPIIP